MFQEWGFLISEMVLLIILAALLGLLVGWIIWGRKGDGEAAARLRVDLDSCHDDVKAGQAELKTARADLKAVRAELDACKAKCEKAEALAEAAEVAAMEAAAEAVAVAEAVEADHGAHPIHPVAAMVDEARDYDGDGVIEGENEGVKPATLAAARDGRPDDLKQIKGVGPKLEQLCHELGFFHFDQVAAWTAAEVAWVDANLKGFKGRVSRDGWVEQAKVLAAGGTTEFANKVKKGEVYD